MKLLTPVVLFVISTAAFSAVTDSGHCRSEEKVIFTCALKNQKKLSVCGDEKTKKIEYRFGRPKKIEMALPAMNFGSIMYSGGGGSYIRFKKDATEYLVYSSFVKGSEDSGVNIKKDGKLIAEISCHVQGEVDFPALEKSGLPRVEEPNPLF